LCPACGGTELRLLLEQVAPVHTSKLLDTREAALGYPSRPVRLEVCVACGLVTNTAFDAPTHDYSASFEETQAFSPRFQAYAGELARALTERHALVSRPVLEIGCGKGDFLERLVGETGAEGVGIDPSWPADEPLVRAPHIRIERAFFQERHVDRSFGLVVCRHTLEHVHDVGGFVTTLHRALRPWPETAVVFEVPDTARILREAAFWDVYYEHCSYFTPGSLARAFRTAGFVPRRLELTFDDQYVLLTAAPAGDGSEALELEEPAGEIVALAEGFSTRVEAIRRHWRDRLAAAARRDATVVVWGGGSKAVGFLAFLGVRDEIACVVDVNPAKHGMFVPGSGQEIVAPEHLRDVAPELVIVMNPAYADEIRGDLARLGVAADVDVL
jgi:SAM-dependent methyltransferase